MGGYNQYDEAYDSYQGILEMIEDMPSEFLMIFVVALLVGVVIGLALGIMFYLFYSIGLSKMGKNRGMTKTFLAFIPIANSWFAGALSDHINAANGKRTNHRTTLLILNIISEVWAIAYLTVYFQRIFMGPASGVSAELLSQMALITDAISIVILVFFSITMYSIFKEYSPRCAVAFLVLSILFSFLNPIFIFAIRNKVGTSQQPKFYYPQPPVYPQQNQ